MPIRTNRGRAAVYRRLWGWPMRSPTHLIGTAIMVIALVVAAGMLAPRLVDDRDTARAGESSSTNRAGADSHGAGDGAADTAPGSEPPPTRLTEPLATPTSAPPSPEALRVAERWVAAWLDHGQVASDREWLDGLRPYTTEEYLPRMRTVDPDRITGTEIVGTPQARASYTSSVDVEVGTDGPTLVLTVIETDSGWRVAEYREASG
ncbi:hypothetical protein [Saccharomonospora iraqiensis]|uniref:hypothetical protein n=1 Tax=Saccharomonospora iraqiensis TaxID=52698 RepID=UPI00022E0455|nr:hypothetical protein [Saccharomonospora iraqiensis]